MREEIEHAMMVLEWLRRRDPDFAEHMRTYLFTELPITEVEDAAEAEEAQESAAESGQADGESDQSAPLVKESDAIGLTLGSLKPRGPGAWGRA